MNDESLGTKVASGLVWSLGEKLLANGVSFIVSMILARLILPEEYGLIALITIFVNISNVFVASGFGTALIQNKDADDKDFSSVFIFELLISFVLYIIIFFAAPFIADFYEEPLLTAILRVYGISIILGSIKNVQHSYVSKHMDFKLFFYSTLGGTLVSAVVGITMAYRGLGVWALVAQVLCNSTMDSIVLFFTIRWKPTPYFSFKRIKKLYSFGWKLLATSLLSTVYDNLYGLIIGKIYNAEKLALYNKGNAFPSLIVNNTIGPIQTATFPALTIAQDDKARLKSMVHKTMAVSSYIMWPMLIGLACVARPMIEILLTDRWIGCVIFLQINSIASILGPLSSANGQMINAVGRSDVSLKLDILKKTIGLCLLFITMPMGIIPFAIGRAVGILIAAILDTSVSKKLIGYGTFEQIHDLLPEIICSSVMALIVIFIGQFQMNNGVLLILQVITGVLSYVIISFLIKPIGFTYFKDIVIKMLKK